MPGSVRENDADVRAFVQSNNIRDVLDVGAGAGTYARLLGDLIDSIDAVEAWQPYISEYGLNDLYREVCCADVRALARSVTDNGEPVENGKPYDLVIFGDVLEHMSADEAKAVWSWGSRVATWGLVSVPIVHYPQGAEGGNPFEVHVQEHMDVDVLGPFDIEWRYRITGTFIRRF